MRNRKKFQIVIIFLGIAFVMFLSTITVIYFKDTSTDVIVKGISLDFAKSKTNEENYYLVTLRSGNTGVEFEVIYGENVGSDITFTMNNPKRSLRKDVFFTNPNIFLVKGTGKTWNNENLGKKLDDNFEDMFTVEAEQWYIVTPIKRDYTYRLYGRWFAPKDFIDQFDVDNGDYIPEKDIGRVIE